VIEECNRGIEHEFLLEIGHACDYTALPILNSYKIP
jgi:hypothetical protein